MPLIRTNTHQPPAWLPNGHYQSIYPALFRKIKPDYHRERIFTPDDDFLDLDWSFAVTTKTTNTQKIPWLFYRTGLKVVVLGSI
jgi:predicted alpha/beta-fold hydrolase